MACSFRSSLADSLDRVTDRLLPMVCALFLGVGCTPRSDDMGEQRAYIERLGNDTIAVEVYARTANGFRGELLIRSPVTRVARYEATLNRQGAVERMEVEWTTPPQNPGGPEPIGYTYTRDVEGATIELRGGRNPGTTRIAVPTGAIPLVGRTPVAYAVHEQAISQALAGGADSFPINLVSPGRGRVVPNAIVRVSADTVSMDFFGSPLLARVDESGRILGRTGERTTLKSVGELVADVDIGSLAADFAARDARGEGMGVASPEATVEVSAGGASLTIVYSRPAKRGRDIWGGLVPYHEVWRTGANAATTFSTDRDLEIGSALVPAGDYTLFSIYAPESAQLIINKQTGQWGTVYNQERDLARVELTRESLPDVVERFTISVEPAMGGGMLQLSWDRTRFSVPIKVR